MEFDELLITTGVDALVRRVKERGRIELPLAAKELGIEESTLEEWARILEEQGILRIQYRLTKVFLEWVTPTEEQVAAEKKAFYERKTGLGKEVEEVRARVQRENEELARLRQGMDGWYAQLAPRLEALEKVGILRSEAPVAAPGLEGIQTRISGMRKEMAGLRDEWKGFEKRAKQAAVDIEEERTRRAEELVAALDALQKRMEKIRLGIPREMPGKEIEKRAEALRKEFQEIQKKEARIREDLRGVGEAGEIVSEMKGHLEKHQEAIGTMRSELETMRAQFTALQEQMNAFGKKSKEELEAMERFSDSVGVAQGILVRYPTQDRVLQELESMQQREKAIQEKMGAVEKLLTAMGSPKDVVAEFNALRDRITEEKKALRGGTEAFEKAMQEQKSLFETFEKIRERTTKSMEGYTKELLQMQKQLDVLGQQGKQVQTQWEEQARAWSRRAKEKDFQETLKSVEGLQGKRKLLEEIQQAVSELSERGDALTRKLNLVGQQARMLELRSGAAGAPAVSGRGSGSGTVSAAPEDVGKEQEIRTQLTLTQQEEEEFRRKREELKELIKKLWEQA